MGVCPWIKGEESILSKDHLFFEVTPLLPAGKGDATLNLKFGASKQVDKYLSIGGAIGLHESFKFNTVPMMPLVLRLHAEGNKGDFSPFFNFDVGYSFNLKHTDCGQVIINPSVGVAYNKFTFALGYYGEIATYSQPAGVSSVFSNINLTLGYRFGAKRKGRNLDGLTDYFRTIRFYAELGVALPLAGDCDSEETAQGLGLSANFALLGSLTDTFSFGITTGYTMFSTTYRYTNSNNEQTTDHNLDGDGFVPYALRARYDIVNAKIGNVVHPYIQMDLGGASTFSISDMEHLKTIFYYAPAVGLSMDIRGGRSSVDLGLTYSPAVYRDFNTQNWDEYYTKGMLRIGIGYKF